MAMIERFSTEGRLRMPRAGRRAATGLIFAAAVVAGFPGAAAANTPHPDGQSFVSEPGYHATAPAGSDWTITGSITIPQLTCPASGFAEIDPSLYGHALQFDQDIEVGEEIRLECNDGVASYRPFFLQQSLPDAPMPITLSPGDTVKMTLVDQLSPGGTFTMTVRDGGQTATLSGGAFPVQNVWAHGVIQCADDPHPCGPPWPDFPPFGKIGYQHVTVNSLTLAQLGATGLPGRNGATGKIKTSPLDSTGAGFVLKWKHS
jgi:hypothetical protein